MIFNQGTSILLSSNHYFNGLPVHFYVHTAACINIIEIIQSSLNIMHLVVKNPSHRAD